MPEGKPKTDEERKETHKEKYGNEDIPEERKGEPVKKRRLSVWDAIAIVLLLYVLWLLIQNAG